MAEQQFVLRWHHHEITLLRNLPCLFESDLLTDVTLSVGSQHVKAHRLVLAMCSVYFFQLFQEMGNVQHPVVVLHDVGIEEVKAVLSFIYRGQCVVSQQRLPALLSVARSLKIQGLCDVKVPEKSSIRNDSVRISTENDNNNNNSEDLNPPRAVEETKKCDNRENVSEKLNLPAAMTDNEISPQNLRKPPHKDSSETCKCFLCGKYLSNQYNLRVHMETHEEAYHACQSCPHVSRSRDALRKHVSYRHPEEYHTRKRKKT